MTRRTVPIDPQPTVPVVYDGYDSVENLHYWEETTTNTAGEIEYTENYMPFACPHAGCWTVEHDGAQWVWAVVQVRRPSKLYIHSMETMQ